MAEIRVEPKRSGTRWVWILLLLVVICGALAYYYFYMTPRGTGG
jgi:flagellar basal body-associated protein FliL